MVPCGFSAALISLRSIPGCVGVLVLAAVDWPKGNSIGFWATRKDCDFRATMKITAFARTVLIEPIQKANLIV